MEKNLKPGKMIQIPDKKKVENEYAHEMKDKTRTIDPRPSFSISAETLPAIKNWSTGQKYMMIVEVEQIGSRIEDWGDDKGKLVGNFKICAVQVENEEEEEDEEGLPKKMYSKKKE